MTSCPDHQPLSIRSACEGESRTGIAAVIVLYYPNAELLKRLVDSVINQAECFIVVDNTPNPAPETAASFARYEDRIFYLPMGENSGIATAHNVGIRFSYRFACSHILLLDQDSALPVGAVDALLAAERSLLSSGTQVAAVGPLFVDEKSGKRSCAVHHWFLGTKRIPIPPTAVSPVKTDYLISSGSLIRTAVLEQVGLMRDELFIDWVDAEWGFRARSVGYGSYIVPGVVMLHSIGDATARVAGHEINLHSPARNYYIVRNAAFLVRHKRMGLGWRIGSMINIPKHIVVHSWLSPHRWESLKGMLSAVREGILGTMRKFPES